MADPVRVEGIEKLLAKIENLAQLRPIVGALKLGGLHLKGKVSIYPEVSAANSPGRTKQVRGRTVRLGYYKRGTGWVSTSGKVYPTSQTFSKKWTIKSENAGLRMVVGNNVTYGPYLMDKEKQCRWAPKVGWRTIQDIAEEEAPTIVGMIKTEVDRVIAEK